MRKILVLCFILTILPLVSLCDAATQRPIAVKSEKWNVGSENHHPLSTKKEKWGLGVGLGVYWGSSEYKGKGGGYSPMPVLNYDSQYFYIRGLNGGVHLYHSKKQEFNIQLTYLSQSFSAKSSDDIPMKLLDNRKASLGGGVNYVVKTNYGVGQFTLTSDLLGVSYGLVGTAAYVVPWHTGRWDIIPSIGVQWTDALYNRHYYGVSRKESRRSGLRKYEPGCAFSPGAQMVIKYNFYGDWNVFAHGGITLLGAPIRNSPMVDSDTKTSLSFGILYDF